MISLDTNVLARYLLGDDIHQQKQAEHLLAHHQCFLLNTVILELAWVLKSNKIPKAIMIEKLIQLSRLTNIHLENKAAFIHAMRWSVHGMDIADAFHLALAQQHSHLPMATFDIKFIQKSQAINQNIACQNVADFTA